METYKDKTILITGASSGIGLATAKKFLNENYKVVISSRNITKLEKAKKKLLNNSKNKEIYFYPCDISKREEVKKVREDEEAVAARDEFMKVMDMRPKGGLKDIPKAIDTIKKIVADKQNQQVKFHQ